MKIQWVKPPTPSGYASAGRHWQQACEQVIILDM